MPRDLYPTHYAPPAADLRLLEPPHTGLGIASFLIAVVVGIGELTIVGWIAYLTNVQPGKMTPESTTAIVLGLLMLGGLTVAFLGAGLGVGGLFHKNRQRIFAVLGLVFNALILAAFMGLIAIGLLFKPS